MITNHDTTNHKDVDERELLELKDEAYDSSVNSTASTTPTSIATTDEEDSDVEENNDDDNELKFAVYSTFFKDKTKKLGAYLASNTSNFTFKSGKH